MIIEKEIMVFPSYMFILLLLVIQLQKNLEIYIGKGTMSNSKNPIIVTLWKIFPSRKKFKIRKFNKKNNLWLVFPIVSKIFLFSCNVIHVQYANLIWTA
jgi:hypothetical protein